MSAPETRADMLRRVLAENGVLKQAPDGIHSWRCEYPSRYGPCSCRDDLVADIESELDARDAALRALVAEWRGEERHTGIVAGSYAAGRIDSADELERAMGTDVTEPIVLDPACGSRMFYFDKTDERVLFGDLRSETHALCDGRALTIEPTVRMDYRSLPFTDGQFRVVVFDPPHLVNVGPKSWTAKKYGRLNRDTWREDLRAAFAECFRVLAPNGVLIFKWSEVQIPVSQVLELTEHKPLVGHRTGKSAGTHWITFLKDGALPFEVGA